MAATTVAPEMGKSQDVCLVGNSYSADNEGILFIPLLGFVQWEKKSAT